MGRVLIFVYGLFALSATARAGVQIGTKFEAAPAAYLLSGLAGVIYISATAGLVLAARNVSAPREQSAWAAYGRRVALICCSVELIGVLVIGAVSLNWPAQFPDATVWSQFGQGYGYVPLVLPVLGLIYLLRRPTPAL